MKALSTIIILLCLRSVAIGKEEPDGKACYIDQELSFFCKISIYVNAKIACEEKDSHLAKIDSANMTEVVNSLIDRVACPYREDIFTGATATPHPDSPKDGSKRIWKWYDGSKVYLPSDAGYQNWEFGQPDDIGGREDCLLLRKWTNKWADGPCNEAKYYICQKTTAIQLKTNKMSDEAKCYATAGYCETRVEWRIGETVVSNNNRSTLYQTKLSGSSTLHHGNATIDDAGRYTCVSWVVGDEENLISSAVDILVNGTPNILDVASFACNTSLQISWQPHFRSLGFPHRISATSRLTGKLVKVFEITPNKTTAYFTEFAKLEPSTEYTIKVVACKLINNCSNEYATTSTATTMILAVTNAQVHQTNTVDSDTCLVTWEWHHNIHASFQIKLKSTSLSSTSDITIKEPIDFTNYSFNPISEQMYEIKIQPVTDKKYCSMSIKAVGSCVGKKPNFAESSSTVIIIPTVTVPVLLLVVSITVLLLRKRRNIPTQEIQTSVPSLELYDSNRVMNDVEYLNVSNAPIYHTIASAGVGQPYANVETNVHSVSSAYEIPIGRNVSTYEM